MNVFTTKKRQQFHSQIRSQYIKNYMMKIRYQLLQQQNTSFIQELNNLIEETSFQISQQQMKRLLKYAYEDDENNAIIHIGNLLIDKVISVDGYIDSVMGSNKLQFKDSRYWLWLVRVVFTLIDINSSNSQHNNNNNNNNQHKHQHQQQLYTQWYQRSVHYVLNKFTTTTTINQSSFTIIECLQILKLLLTPSNKHKQQQHYKQYKHQNQQLAQQLLINHPAVFIKLKNHCLHFDKKVSQLSYQIIDQIIQLGDQYTIQLISICSLSEIQRVLISGFNKLDHAQKKFPLIIIRIVNNIYASNIPMSRQMIRGCVQACMNPHNTERVRVEFSYLWLSFCEMCECQVLMSVLVEEKVLYVFSTLLICSDSDNGVQKQKQKSNKTNNSNNSNSYNNSKFITIVNNVYNSLQNIQQKLNQLKNNNNNNNQHLQVLIDIDSRIKLLITQCQLILLLQPIKCPPSHRVNDNRKQQQQQAMVVISVSNIESTVLQGIEKRANCHQSHQQSMDLE